jgi:hypothetical protein
MTQHLEWPWKPTATAPIFSLQPISPTLPQAQQPSRRSLARRHRCERQAQQTTRRGTATLSCQPGLLWSSRHPNPCPSHHRDLPQCWRLRPVFFARSLHSACRHHGLGGLGPYCAGGRCPRQGRPRILATPPSLLKGARATTHPAARHCGAASTFPPLPPSLWQTPAPPSAPVLQGAWKCKWQLCLLAEAQPLLSAGARCGRQRMHAGKPRLPGTPLGCSGAHVSTRVTTKARGFL